MPETVNEHLRNLPQSLQKLEIANSIVTSVMRAAYSNGTQVLVLKKAALYKAATP